MSRLFRLHFAVYTAIISALPLSQAVAQPVIFTLETNNGNDSVYIGIPSNLQFHADANGASVAAFCFAAEFKYTGGNWLGPMDDAQPGAPDNVVPSALSITTFASISWNQGYGSGGNPDTALYGFVSFGGPWTASGEVWRVNFTPTGAGTLVVDPIFLGEPPLPPANNWDAFDGLGASLPLQADLPTITSVLKPKGIPECDGATGPSTLVFGDLASGLLFYSCFDGDCEPVSFVLESAVNSNATGPNNPINIVGNTWSWQTSNANQDDVGHWTLTFRATNGDDVSSSSCVVEFDVIAEEPLICFSFGCMEAFSG